MTRNSATGCFELTIQKKQKAEKGEKNHVTAQHAFLKTYNIPLKNWDATQQAVYNSPFKKMKSWKSWEEPRNSATGIFEDVWYSTKKLRCHATAQQTVSNSLFKKNKKAEKAENSHATAQQAFLKTYTIPIKNWDAMQQRKRLFRTHYLKKTKKLKKLRIAMQLRNMPFQRHMIFH